jgi:formylglycine-generating enzyme required for sulfatase activity
MAFARRTPVLLLLLALLVSACAEPRTLRLRVSAAAGVGALDALAFRARVGAEPAVGVSEPHQWVLGGRDLSDGAVEVEIRLEADSAFATTARVVVWGLQGVSLVASGVVSADLAGTGTLDVVLSRLDAACDADHDGFKACVASPACCSAAEAEGFADCDDTRSAANPFADTAACRTCQGACASTPEADVSEADAREVLSDAADVPSDPRDVPDLPETGEVEGDQAEGSDLPEVVADVTPPDVDHDPACVPDCTGRACGDDGCGGSCGTCAASDACHLPGTCTAATGQCTNPSKDCDDSDPATVDSCESTTGQCRHLPAPDPGFVLVPPGTFWMGSPAGQPCPTGYTGGGCPASGTATAEAGREVDETLHAVQLTRAFELQAREVTQADWKVAFPGWNPSAATGCGDECPVEHVSWYDALVYANVRSVAAGLTPCYELGAATCENGDQAVSPADCMTPARGGIDWVPVSLNGVANPYDCAGFRLPTEAEWEYAYRAGSATPVHPSPGNDGHLAQTGCTADANAVQIAWYCGNAGNVPHPVGVREPNAWGAYDLSGNVTEWVWDRVNSYASGTLASPVIDPVVVAGSGSRLLRGGSYAAEARYVRAAMRAALPGDERDAQVGFRLVRTVCTGTCANPQTYECQSGRCVPRTGLWVDPTSGLVWQKAAPADFVVQAAASTRCSGNDAGLPGSGWRLPTIGELRTLVRGCPVCAPGGACGVTDDCLGAGCWSGECYGCPDDEGPADGCYWPEALQGDCTWYWASSPETNPSLAGYYHGMGYHRAELQSTPGTHTRLGRCVRMGP